MIDTAKYDTALIESFMHDDSLDSTRKYDPRSDDALSEFNIFFREICQKYGNTETAEASLIDEFNSYLTRKFGRLYFVFCKTMHLRSLGCVWDNSDFYEKRNGTPLLWQEYGIYINKNRHESDFDRQITIHHEATHILELELRKIA